MAIEIKVPRLGWNMEEGTFMGWLKRDGEQVRAGEPLFTLEGDKAVQEVEATDSGILRILPLSPNEGDIVAVGAVLGQLLSPGEMPSEIAPMTSTRGGIRQAGNQEPARTAPDAVQCVEAARPSEPAAASRKRPAISPRARRVARELGVDAAQVVGTGRNGRVCERDVVAHTAGSPHPSHLPKGEGAFLPPQRRAIAQRLLRSLRNTVPVTLTTTADATNLVNLRNQFQAAAAAPDAIVPSYTDFLVKLTAIALQSHPVLNARWEGDQVVTSADVHVGIATDTVHGLLVPVIRNVTSMSLREVANRSRELIAKAHARKLTPEEMQGGTFTISNLGALGIDAFTPIINWPECAILGVGRIHQQPVAVQSQIVSRDVVTLSLTFDHRLTDGAPAARFLQTLCQAIENPAAWLVE